MGDRQKCKGEYEVITCPVRAACWRFLALVHGEMDIEPVNFHEALGCDLFLGDDGK